MLLRGLEQRINRSTLRTNGKARPRLRNFGTERVPAHAAVAVGNMRPIGARIREVLRILSYAGPQTYVEVYHRMSGDHGVTQTTKYLSRCQAFGFAVRTDARPAVWSITTAGREFVAGGRKNVQRPVSAAGVRAVNSVWQWGQ